MGAGEALVLVKSLGSTRNRDIFVPKLFIVFLREKEVLYRFMCFGKNTVKLCRSFFIVFEIIEPLSMHDLLRYMFI